MHIRDTSYRYLQLTSIPVFPIVTSMYDLGNQG